MKKENFKIEQELLSKRKANRRSFAVLLDPDKVDIGSFPKFLEYAQRHQVDYFFLGGSLVMEYSFSILIELIHRYTKIPVILFPGSSLHIEASADAILLLSLISGRNPELLIGQHVVAAPLIKRSGIEILPTGYILVESGRVTTVSYISNTCPIPRDKPAIAACTAMAGEMLGLKFIFLDAGSGAQYVVPKEVISAVRDSVSVPIIVGGGIDTYEKAYCALEAGADVIVVGNGIEKNSELLPEIAAAVKSFNGSWEKV